MGYWWLSALSQQRAHSCITSCSEFFGKTSNHPGDSAPLHSIFGTLWLLAFPQTKNHLWKGRDFIPSMRFRKIWWGSWWRLGELCEVPRCILWRGLRHHCSMCNVSCILSINVSIFHITWLDTFWTDLVYFVELLMYELLSWGHLLGGLESTLGSKFIQWIKRGKRESF